MRTILPTLAALVLCAASSPAEDQSAYLPLSIGNEWLLNIEITSPQGQKSLTTGSRKVEGVYIGIGRSYFRVHTRILGGPSPVDYTKMARRDDTGLYTTTEGDKTGREQAEIPLPLKPGATWQTTAGPMTFKSTVIGLEKVDAGGKTYDNCYHIHTEAADKSYREDYWEAPGAGNVKSEVAYGNGSKVSVTLREFKSGK